MTVSNTGIRVWGRLAFQSREVVGGGGSDVQEFINYGLPAAATSGRGRVSSACPSTSTGRAAAARVFVGHWVRNNYAPAGRRSVHPSAEVGPLAGGGGRTLPHDETPKIFAETSESRVSPSPPLTGRFGRRSRARQRLNR